MNDIANDRVGPMPNPPHLGEPIREGMDEVGWNVTETAAHLGCKRGTLSRLLNAKAGVSANMTLARIARLKRAQTCRDWNCWRRPCSTPAPPIQGRPWPISTTRI